MELAALLILVSLAVILVAAELFTNSVEWLGHSLGLSEGPVGSVLAAVGTALPETMIPIIGILFVGSADSAEIGIGAILGAPFLLSTAAFAVTGLGVLYFQRRRAAGSTVTVDAIVLRRDFGFFFLVYLFAVGVSFLPWELGRQLTAAILLCLYGFYVYRTFAHEAAPVEAGEEELAPLRLHRLFGKLGSPSRPWILAQFAVSLALIIGGAQLFVTNLEHAAHDLGVPALILALVIAPLATELPEKFNSIIWVRQGKDTLAMGNISGAMVFQSCIPVSLGVVFTEWHLTEEALVSAGIALSSTGIVYVTLVQYGQLTAQVLARAGIFWLGFVGYVIVKLSL